MEEAPAALGSLLLVDALGTRLFCWAFALDANVFSTDAFAGGAELPWVDDLDCQRNMSISYTHKQVK